MKSTGRTRNRPSRETGSSGSSSQRARLAADLSVLLESSTHRAFIRGIAGRYLELPPMSDAAMMDVLREAIELWQEREIEKMVSLDRRAFRSFRVESKKLSRSLPDLAST